MLVIYGEKGGVDGGERKTIHARDYDDPGQNDGREMAGHFQYRSQSKKTPGQKKERESEVQTFFV